MVGMTRHRSAFGALIALVAAGVTAAVPLTVAHAAEPVATLELVGHGYGHGIGLSQWGAYGYAADLGWSAGQILDHYYGGTVMGTTDAASVTVRLMALDDQQTAVVHDRGALVVDGVAGGPWSSVVARETAPGQYTVWARADRACPAATDAALAAWTVVGAGLASVSIHPQTDTSASADFADLAAVCEPSGRVRSYRGSIRAINGTDGENRTVNEVPLEQYLRPVVASEMSASWAARGSAALQAQAVAARSFGLAENKYSYAKTCDLVCQYYPGAAWRQGVDGTYNRYEQPAVDSNVQATTGLVRRVGSASGAIAYTMFSASSGGWTAASTLPFAAVEDLGDATAGNPNHSWQMTVSAEAIASRYPAIGQFTGITITGRSGAGDWGGRVTTMSVDGTAGSQAVTGDAFRSAMGLKSNWFAVRGTVPATASPIAPVVPVVPTTPGAPVCGDREAPPATGVAGDAPPARFEPIVPVRLIDTRDGTGTDARQLSLGCTLVVRPTVPPGTTAVAVNIVTVDPRAQGYITAYPCGVGRTYTSVVQSQVGHIVSGSAIVPISDDGTFCVFSNITTDVVVDMTGSFSATAPARYEPIVTQRRFDSRSIGQLPAGTVVRVDTRANGGAAADSTGASLTIHALDPAYPGFVTVWPCDQPRPWASSANVDLGGEVTNYADVAVSGSGEACVFISAPMDLAVDLNGWYGPSATTDFHAVTPFRVADTRVGQSWSGPFSRGVTRQMTLAGQGSLPGAGVVRSVAAQFTAVDGTVPGYITVHPCLTPVPDVSMLRYVPRTNVAVLVNTKVDGSGRWCLQTNGSAHLVIDISGWFG
jgi:SpoIID/LytB domain protein